MTIHEAERITLDEAPVNGRAVHGSKAGGPRVRPWEQRPEGCPTLPEIQETEELRQRLLERTGSRPWSPSWQLLAEEEER